MNASSMTLVDRLHATAENVGDTHGILYYDTPDETRYRSYTDLERNARTVADALMTLGYKTGDMVVIGLSTGLEWADAAWGALYAGLAFIPAPVAGYGTGAAIGERIAGMAKAAEASVFLTDASVLARLDTEALGVPVLLLEDLLADGDAEAWVAPAIDADTIAYLLYTSGSTGDPKGVIATHGTVGATADAANVIWDSSPSATLVGWAPMHHIMGLMMQVVIPAVNGANAVATTTEQFQRRPVFWLQLMSKHKATMSAAGNFAFALCTQLATDEQIAELDLSSMKALFSGSEPVRPETVRAFVERFAPAGITEKMIAPVMGMTESNMISGKFAGDDLTVRRFDAVALESGSLVPAEGEGSVEWVSCGRTTDETTVVIVDPDTFLPVPDGAVGEIWVSSPMVSPGYFRRPDATAETFGHTLDEYDGSFMRTGDLAAVLDGELYVTGRLKEMIIVRGRNLYPQDIEAAARTVSPAVGIGACFELSGHPSVVGIVLEVDDEALTESGEGLDDLAVRVRDALMTRISLPSLAVAFVAAGTLPRTPTGKVRRTPTRASIENGTLPTIYSSGFRPALTVA
jgi:acyl-CoA synthetase (AMP-forming)/AMP-acid ligase II